VVGKIKDHYFEIKAGIGLNKSPELYGAFPTDAYSHTPGNAGAQQPGMTGQVKEDFISRMRELGIHIQNGEIVFQPSLFNPDELLNEESIFGYFDLKGEHQQIILKQGQLGFTFCQVPIIYSSSQADKIIITSIEGKQSVAEGHHIDKETSSVIFQRSGKIARIEVLFRNIDK
jgi:hypothetical protein